MELLTLSSITVQCQPGSVSILKSRSTITHVRRHWGRYHASSGHGYSTHLIGTRNIVPPTSAIRDTLVEPHASHWKEQLNPVTSSASYPRYSSPSAICRMEDERTHHQAMRFTLPESPIGHRRHRIPRHVESSRRAAERAHVTINSTSHYSSRVHHMPQRPNPMSLDVSQLPIQTTRKESLSPIATDSTPVPSYLSLGNESEPPPLHRHKRKHSQLRDAIIQESLLAPEPSVEESMPMPHVPNTFPSVLQRDTITQTQSRRVGPQQPEQKLKKNIMDWKIRKQTLEADPLLDAVEAKRVYCKLCKKWVKLDARNDYYPGLWIKHREHHRNKKSDETGGGSRSNWSSEEQLPDNVTERPTRKRRAVGSTHTQHSW